MGLANPGFLYLFATLPALVILYTFHTQPSPRKVSTTFIWRRLMEREKPKKTWLKNFLGSLFFWLHLAFLIFGTISLLGPYWKEGPKSRAVYLLDRSCSMAAAERSGKTRFTLAKEALAQHLKLNPARTISLYTCDLHLAPVVENSPSSEFALESLGNLSPTTLPSGDPGQIEEELIARMGTGCDNFYFFSDNQTFSDRLTQMVANKIHYFFFGTERGNVAVLGAEGIIEGATFRCKVSLLNTADHSQRLNLVLTGQNGERTSTPLTLKPGSPTASPIIHFGVASATEVVTAKIEPHSGEVPANQLTADDTLHYFLRPSILPARIGADLPRPARESLALFPIFASSTVTLPAIELFKPGRIPKVNGIFFCDSSATRPVDGGGGIKSSAHSLLRHCRFDFLVASNRVSLPDGPFKPLWWDNHGPLAVVNETTGRQLLFLFDLEKSTFPQSVAFPILMKNALEWLFARPLDAGGILTQREVAEAPHLLAGLPRGQDYLSLADPLESALTVSQDFVIGGHKPVPQNPLIGQRESPLIALLVMVLFVVYITDFVLLCHSRKVGV